MLATKFIVSFLALACLPVAYSWLAAIPVGYFLSELFDL